MAVHLTARRTHEIPMRWGQRDVEGALVRHNGRTGHRMVAGTPCWVRGATTCKTCWPVPSKSKAHTGAPALSLEL